jgi:DsbC/DsbD-like thiol-disulfide interchange protein
MIGRIAVDGRFLESKYMIRFKFNIQVCLLFLILGLVSSRIAVAQSDLDTKSPIKIQLQTYPSQISAGQHAWIAVTITLNSGWHIYGNPKGPGPGLPTTIGATSIPEGVQVEAPRFLPAEKLVQPDLDPEEWVWAYKEKTTIYVRLSTSSSLPSGSHQVGFRFRALLCRDGLCMPHQADLVALLTIVSDVHALGTIPQWLRKEIELTDGH